LWGKKGVKIDFMPFGGIAPSDVMGALGDIRLNDRIGIVAI
jgi:hypothetical protein